MRILFLHGWQSTPGGLKPAGRGGGSYVLLFFLGLIAIDTFFSILAENLCG
jgi:hypothetical protein